MRMKEKSAMQEAFTKRYKNPAESGIIGLILLYLMPPTKKKQVFPTLILGLLSAIGPFSIDMYLPGFPQIAKNLGTTVARVTLSLSSFFIGISVGQFLYGPLLDRYGREKPLYAGISLSLLASACYARV